MFIEEYGLSFEVYLNMKNSNEPEFTFTNYKEFCKYLLEYDFDLSYSSFMSLRYDIRIMLHGKYFLWCDLNTDPLKSNFLG